jgi:broad specificity phosphatase PhoE/predicted nucleotidyltransferase
MSEDFRQHLKKGIRSAITSQEFITSGTIVGSFAEDGSVSEVSDIDIVVIVDELTETKYESVVAEFNELGGQIKLDYGYEVALNTTFGPLKFDHQHDLVLHVMVYSEDRHRHHCGRSPFTCLAWQTSDTFFKRPMTEIYKVPMLQPNHFFEKRRSIADYLSDLNGETISYREYEFDDGPQMVRKEKEMTDKDRFEFSYHIMKFTMRNFLKLYYRTNEHYDLSETVDRYFSIFPERADEHTAHLLSLHEMKTSGDFAAWRDTHEEAIRTFLEDFEAQFKEYFDDATSVYVLRHAETDENDGETFLGQRRDPGIRDDVEVQSLPGEVGRLYSSPLKRSYQTASVIKSRLGLSEQVVDDRLSEIDYGKAEGLTYDELEEEYPEIVDGWSRAQDPRFPDGENTQDVWNRVAKFLESIEYGDEDTAVVTHNVVLRCILGSQYHVPMSEWYEIVVPHTEPFELLVAENGQTYINLTEEQVETCFQNVEFRDGQ